MLHQYSRNLASHGAITYYAGGPHTEGATDFGWMLFLAAAIRIGFSPVIATALVNGVSLALLALTLLRIASDDLEREAYEKQEERVAYVPPPAEPAVTYFDGPVVASKLSLTVLRRRTRRHSSPGCKRPASAL